MNGKGIYHQNAIAEAPLGKHELIVRYSKKGKDTFANNTKAKGISIVLDDKPSPAKVISQMNYQFVTKK